jgi:hypothetical protein
MLGGLLRARRSRCRRRPLGEERRSTRRTSRPRECRLGSSRESRRPRYDVAHETRPRSRVLAPFAPSGPPRSRDRSGRRCGRPRPPPPAPLQTARTPRSPRRSGASTLRYAEPTDSPSGRGVQDWPGGRLQSLTYGLHEDGRSNRSAGPQGRAFAPGGLRARTLQRGDALLECPDVLGARVVG